MTPPITVAVVSWNTRELLGRCLRSFAADVHAGVAEVWVVDNRSSDGSPELVRSEFPWARLVVAESNLGFGPAVNVVARQTASAWIAPANADIEATPGALDALLRAGAEDPQAGIIAPKLLLPDGSVQRSVYPFPTLTTAALFHLHLYRFDRAVGERLCLPGYWDRERPRRADWATGAFLLVRRQPWSTVGGFDDEQWMYAEDIDLAWRLRRAGWATRYEPRAVFRHALSAAASQAFGSDWKRATRSTVATYAWIARRRGWRVAWAVAAANVLGSGARLATLSVLARVLGGRWEERRRSALHSVRLHRLGLRSRSALLGSR